MSGKFCFAIDRGGTFTDVLCICPNGKVRTLKLLSVDPQRYDDAPREGIRRILAEVKQMEFLMNETFDNLISWNCLGDERFTNGQWFS